MSKVKKKAEITGQVTIKNPRTTVYSGISGAIEDVINLELTEPQPDTRLGDIKIRGLTEAIGTINVKDFEIDTKAIIKALKANSGKVKAFIESHGNYRLRHTKAYQLPILEATDKGVEWVNKDIYEPLFKYFEPAEKILNPKPDGKPFTFKGYKITDYEGLVEAIKKTVPAVNRHGLYNPTDDEQEAFTRDIDPILLEFSKLAKDVGIEPSGDLIVRRIKNIDDNSIQATWGGEYTEPSKDPKLVTTDIRVSDRAVYIYTLYAIVAIKEKTAEGNRKVVNIKNAEKHDVLMQPHAMGLTDMIDGAFEGRELKNLFNDYRKGGYGTNDEIKKEGGWLVHLSGQQAEIPFDFGENDPKTIIKFMTNVKALVLDVTTALGRYLRDHPNHDPNDYISIIDLARYIGRFNDTKLKNKNELRPAYRQQILMGLTMAQLISADYVVGKDKKGNKIWRKVYLLDRITDYKTYGNTDIVTAVKVDFTKEYKESVGLNLGVILDGVLLLSTVEHKALGAYILERFAQFQETTKKGEPQKITADTLLKKAGITDSNKTTKLNTLQKALDTLKEKGLITGWACKNGAKNITNYDRASQTILIYPTQNLIDSYQPVNQTKAEQQAIKLEQKSRLAMLKKWFKGYTSRETASQHLGISVAELNELLAGSKIISDDVLEKINEEF